MPLPVPETVNVSATAFCVKVAVTVFGKVMVTVQLVPVLVSQPVQLPNVQPDAGAAVSVTPAPLAYAYVQLVPQLIYPSLLVTVPAPVVETVRVWVGAAVTITGRGTGSFVWLPATSSRCVPYQ
jgi:hypothetical protein